MEDVTTTSATVTIGIDLGDLSFPDTPRPRTRGGSGPAVGGLIQTTGHGNPISGGCSS